jgi:hypothetical protein
MFGRFETPIRIIQRWLSRSVFKEIRMRMAVLIMTIGIGSRF